MAGIDGGRQLAVLALMVNAFVWGVSWWPLRELQSHGLHPLWATAGVYLAALALLAVLQPRAWRGLAGHPELLVLMAAAGLTNVGFNWAVTVGDVVRVVLLFYLMPAWSVLLAWPLLGERPTPAALLRLALALAGVLVILKTPETPWPLPESLADGLALLGGFSFALTNILLRRLHRTPPATRVVAMFLGGTIAATAVGTLAMGQGLVPAPVALPSGALLVAGLLGLAFLLGNSALQYGAARLAAQTTALVMLSEVLFASVSSVLAGAAQLSERTWVGGALVVAAAAWSACAAPGEDRAGAAQSAA
ncbi:DMT family transporter [Ramlibacter tataouinensis]|uniref:DMT family transporter n=1 Tax=Ramlibacter tataouinensis TaxID=94132 RepID=UPI0022F3D202|nr:DMT family transporter [Ramlibacter tataouinensis]WBX99950.1 DMT family transporter [Ramlibacter tataouinensis]